MENTRTSRVLRRLVSVLLVASVMALIAQPFSTNADTVSVSTNVQTVVTFGVDSGTMNLGNLTPTTPVTGTSVLTVDTNDMSGYYLQASYTTATCAAATTLCHSDTTTTITDKTDFTGIADCTESAVWSGTGLGFTVFAADTNKDTTCWGAGTTVTHASNKYVGFPSVAKTILNTTSGPLADDDTSVGYKLDVATTQKSGAYSGSVVFTATGN